MIKIFFFGDSINFGQNISVDKNWVTRIGETLNREDSANWQRVIIQNPSVNGNTTRMALERMPHDVQSHEVDILVVTFGMNDCNYWVTDKGVPRVSPEAFKANMKEIITRGYIHGVKQVIIHTNHPSPRQDIMTGSKISYSDSNHSYNDIIREIAETDERVMFADIEKVMLQFVSKGEHNISDFTQEDGIHLSEVGNNIYYNEIFPLVKQAILCKLLGE